jgi:methionyl-tRNA formyltransferase
LRIVYMGSPEYAVSPLQHLILNGHEIAAVYTRPDKPAGRGRTSLATPLKNAALTWSLPVVQLPTLKSPHAAEQLARLKPDAIVVAAYGQFIPQPVLNIPRYGCLNIHPSLLPKYRGASPVPAAILAGDEFAGVSVMQLDAGWDTGPIFSRAQIPILPTDTAGSLTSRLFLIGAFLLLDILAVLPAGKLIPEPQNAAQASYFPEITKEEGKIDWKSSAIDIWRRVRAYQPWPEAHTYWQGKQLKIIEAVPLKADEAAEAGRVVPGTITRDLPGVAVGVSTGQGVLIVLRVQIEGKQAMPADQFLRGQRNFIGSVLS